MEFAMAMCFVLNLYKFTYLKTLQATLFKVSAKCHFFSTVNDIIRAVG